MKTLMFCTGYFATAAPWQQRYSRWVDYYSRLDLPETTLLIIDDGSPFTPPESEARVVPQSQVIDAASRIVQILRFDQNLGRLDHDKMPGWWRSFLHSVVVAKSIGARRIIHVESDAFILSKRLLDHLMAQTSGWTALWTERYRMPETAIQVICEDQFDKMEWLRNQPQEERYGRMAEKILPFTQVDRQFIGDRYSETRAHRGILKSSRFNGLPLFKHDFFWAKIPHDADFATQVIPQQVLRSSLCQPAWIPPSPLPPRDMQVRCRKG